MEKEVRINLGDTVLVFKNKELLERDGLEKFIKGTVIGIKESVDIAYHGSPWKVKVYEVLGEDGKIHSGSHQYSLVGDSYFYKPEEYVRYLKQKERRNDEAIQRLLNKKEELRRIVEIIEKKKHKKIVIVKPILENDNEKEYTIISQELNHRFNDINEYRKRKK